MPPNALCRLKVGFELSHILSLDDVFRIWIVRSRVEPWPSHNAKQFAPTMPPPLSLSLHVGVYIDTNRLSRKPDLKLG